LDQLKACLENQSHKSQQFFVFSCLSSEMWETLKCFVESRKTKQPKLEKPKKLGFTLSPEFGTWF
jgi:hypothetical protein